LLECKRPVFTRPKIKGKTVEKRKILQAGNKKLSSDILIFNLPPIVSCPNCKECRKSCYAVKAYRQYPNVKIAWDKNYNLAKNNISELKRMIISELKSTKKSTVRIHSSGDFFSHEYIAMWNDVIQLFPGKQFYSYTKVRNAMVLNNNNNCNMISSFIHNKLNYGPIEYCMELRKQYKTIICPAGLKKGIVCGKDCDYCITKNNVVFVQH